MPPTRTGLPVAVAPSATGPEAWKPVLVIEPMALEPAASPTDHVPDWVAEKVVLVIEPMALEPAERPTFHVPDCDTGNAD